MALYYAGRIAVPSTSKTTLHDRFTKFMKNRPSKLDVIATPARASERNQRLAAEMESRDSVKSAINRDNRKWGKPNHSSHPHFQPYQHHRPNNQKGKASTSDSKKSKSKKSKNKSNEKNEKDDEGNRKKQKPEVDPKDLDAELEAYNAARAKKKDNKKDDNDADPLSKDTPSEEHDDILATKEDVNDNPDNLPTEQK